MQPQDTPAPPSPNPNYDFILKDQPQPKKSLMPSFGMPKKALGILLGTILVFLVVVVLATVLKGGGNSTPMVEVLGKGQEILRVTKLVEPLAQDADTQGLAATTDAAFSSQLSQVSAYLAKANIKTDAKSLAVYQNKNTDAQVRAAAQDNSLAIFYAGYLKQDLSRYQTSLKASAKGASAARLQILNDAYVSTQTLLSAPQVASS